MIRAHVYIDGYNLYYQALKRTPYKWLNVDALCHKLFPGFNVCKIRYFTALVRADESDPDQADRQLIYLRALGTLPKVEIHYGRFIENPGLRPLADNPKKPDGSWNTVRVLISEEKGSDVNLATYLLCDGYKGLYDTAVLITNDSDFEEPIKAVRNELKKDVWVLSPSEYVSATLKAVASDSMVIWRRAIRDSQFSTEMRDLTGTFRKPRSW